MIESFGMALCESMLCGCIPIISNIPVLVEIANGQGYILEKKDISLLSNLVKLAIKDYELKNHIEFDHIHKNYSISKRNIQLFDLINKL